MTISVKRTTLVLVVLAALSSPQGVGALMLHANSSSARTQQRNNFRTNRAPGAIRPVMQASSSINSGKLPIDLIKNQKWEIEFWGTPDPYFTAVFPFYRKFNVKRDGDSFVITATQVDMKTGKTTP